MASDEVIRSVSRKLKYYFQIKRLEDSFDLSGPQVPVLDHPPRRCGPLVHYPSVYDRSLKHYFSHPEARIQLTQFKSPLQQGESLDKMQTLISREKKIRKLVVRHLKRSNFKEPPVPYEAFMMTKNGPRLRPELRGQSGPFRTCGRKPRGFSGAYPVLRTVPNSDISKLEGDRLVQNATKLLLATETIDLTSRKHRTTASGSKLQYLPRKTNEAGRRRKRTGSRASGASSDRTSDKLSRPQSSDSVPRDGMPPWLSKEISRRLAEEDSAGADQSPFVRTYSAPTPPKNERPRSATGRRFHRRTVGDGSENISTQTERKVSEDEQSLQLVPNKDHVDYGVKVTTGTQIGASTNAEVAITLYGSLGRTEETILSNSRTNRLPFRKGQTDEFVVSLPYVGALKRIQIGHNTDMPGSDWFVASVTVHDPRTNEHHFLPCGRWMSAREVDGLTKRVLSVSSDRAPVTGPQVKSFESEESRSRSSTKREEEEAAKKEESAAEDEDEEYSEISSTVTVRSDRPESGTGGYSTESETETESESETESENEAEAEAEEEEESQKVGRFAVTEEELEDVEEEAEAEEESSAVGVETAPESEPSHLERDRTEEAEEEDEEVARVEDAEEGGSVDLQDKRVVAEKTIHQAVEDGDLSRVIDLVSSNPHLVNNLDERGFSPLHIACERDHVHILEWLCGNGAALHAETTTGYQAVHLATLENNLQCMMALIALGADLNGATTDGQTPLHIAAKNGHLEAVRWLVGSNADVERRDLQGMRPVAWAQQYGHHKVVQFLHSLSSSANEDDEQEEQEPTPPPTRVVPKSVSRRRTEEKIMQDKKEIYDKQQQSLTSSEVSFLDYIRNEAGND